MDKKDNKVKKSSQPEAPQPLKVKVTSAETSRILDEVFQNGYATIEFDIIPNKLKATLRTLRSKEQMLVDQYLGTAEGSSSFLLHTYTLKVLSYTLEAYGEKTFKDSQEVENFLADQSNIVIDKLIKIQNSFEKQVKEVLQFEKINDHFFEQPSTLKN